MDQQQALREGMTVYGADGEKVGKVVAVDPAYVVVEKGFFFPTDYYVPTSAIANATADELYLTVSKDEALNQGWDQPLAATEGYATGYETVDDRADTSAGLATNAGAGAAVDVASRGSDMAATDEVIAPEYTAADDTGTATGGDAIRVPVHEEELQAVTRERDLGAVRIEKDVVAEERTIDVPVTEERVRVRQVAASGAAEAGAFEGGAIEVPIRGEEVELQKRAVQTGAVEVEKEAVQRTERVAGTVRREQVRVDDQTVAGGDEATDPTK